ncbi:DNA repair protein RecO [Lentibacillus sediminis]|uniref:DNA repair protein RecO n=1 Tax=Lentibacillus sediminis TaxID=1940529 RepID=UPI000C1B7F79|nr:DNA repair protein RecO [Lentibacillus sediminis]
MLEKMDGIVLRTSDYGETHKIVTAFSGKLGKFSAIAKGAKKPKSRMAAVTQPFIYGEFLVYAGRGLGSIQQGDIVDSFRSIREDIVKTAYAAYISELTDKLMEEKSPDAYIFKELKQTLEWIATHEDAEIPVMMLELKLFQKGGFAPKVEGCANCSRREGPFAFSIAEGGLLCDRCRQLDEHAVSLPDKMAGLLHLFSKVELERIGSISVKPKNKELLRRLLDAYYDQYGGYYLKSRKFLSQLDRLR